MVQTSINRTTQLSLTAPYKLVAPPTFPVAYLRHGQHEDYGLYRGISDDPLTREGIAQARKIGDFFATYIGTFFQKGIREGGSLEVYTSPQPRAMETADIATDVIVQKLKLSAIINVDNRIGEFHSPPPVQGMPLEELNRLYRGNPTRHSSYILNGGELTETISERSGSFLNELYTEFSNNGHNPLPRLVMTHGAVLQFIKYHHGVFPTNGIELIDKDSKEYPYVTRGDGFIARLDMDGKPSVRRLRIQDNSRTL